MQKTLAALLLLVLISAQPISSFGQTFRPRSRVSPTTKAQTGKRLIELRVLVDEGGPLGGSHQWMQALAEVGADRLLSETSRVSQPSFEEYGTGSVKTLAIVGVVKQGKLHLPGGKFTIRQTSAIRDHLQKLRDDGGEVTIAKKLAFGLTAKQLISVHDQLGVAIESTTAEKGVGQLATELLTQSGYTISIDEATKQVISAAEANVDAELEGFSIGMGLALSLRQMGLVFEPQRPQGGEIRLLVRKPDEQTKHWPVGWPISETRKELAPNLFIKVPVQAFDTPITDLLGAIESRAKISFFYDRALISQAGIKLDETKVTFSRPGKKTSFDTVISKVLTQVKPKLKSEMKIDEVGKPFLWITTR